MNASFDVIVVGGGVTGAAVGYGLAKKGVRTCIVDAVPTFSRASRANMGLIWCQSKALGCPPFVRWGFASSRAYGALAAELKEASGIDTGYAATGGIIPCLGEEELAQRALFIDKLRAETEDGVYPASMLSRAELEKKLPKVPFGPEVSGGTWSEMDGYVDPLHLIFAFRKAFTRAGGTLLAGERVSAVTPSGGGYRLDCGERVLECGKLVLASGLGTRKLALQLGADIPVFPNKSQVLLLERIPADVLPIPLLGIARTFGGTVMIGAAHDQAGMDRDLHPETLAANADWAARVWPELARKRILRFWTGLRVWPKDAYPIYDRIPGHENAFVFVMHSAVSLAAILERTLPDYVLGQPLPPDAALFTLSRFADGDGFKGSAASSPHATAPAKAEAAS
ncbi:MAG TPA: FAD-binding oxidoreductase [Candidatus Bilophila faecipullorum]|uniref:FAD-binding oxidoreductase n=2 Tax=Bilophila TaxID=35832 RepID=A0A9D1R447_9BACT|nr:FAD-dependent oxidoreductase [uncultured Bilophila sp.]HIW79762.1 FAD-binding oxidoreductase [Candidatus Bilophila faecipullorum]